MPHDHDDIFEANNATRSDRGPVDHPTMLSSCARAATAEEARYRVKYPNSLPRTSRIFALDQRAAEAMYGVTEDPWDNAHFLTVLANCTITPDTSTDAIQISHPDGAAADLDAELTGADVVVLLATDGSSEGVAEVIARACFERKIMCAGIALRRGASTDRMDKVVNSMRKFTRVLVVAHDDDYIPAMLTALRA
jgi:hypothetical protein